MRLFNWMMLWDNLYVLMLLGILKLNKLVLVIRKSDWQLALWNHVSLCGLCRFSCSTKFYARFIFYFCVFPVCPRIVCISLLLGLKCISFALRCMLPLGKSVGLLTSALISLYNMVSMWKKRNNIIPVWLFVWAWENIFMKTLTYL